MNAVTEENEIFVSTLTELADVLGCEGRMGDGDV